MAELQFQTLTSNECVQLAPGSKCYAIHQYFIREGYQGVVNQHKVNIKRSVSLRSSNSVFQDHFTRSIRAVASDLSLFLNRPEVQPYVDLIIVLPSSKKEDHPEYNDKSRCIADALQQLVKTPVTSNCLRIHKSHDAAHLGGSRSVVFHFDNYYIDTKCQELFINPKTIVVIDDLITSGGHFEGVKSRLLTTNQNHTIIGLFWARAVERNSDISLEDIPSQF